MTACIASFHESMLAPTLAATLNLPHVKVFPKLFAGGEFALPPLALGGADHLMFVADFSAAGNDQIHIELLALAVLLRQVAAAGPRAVTVVMPYLPYGRTDDLEVTPLGLLFDQLRRFALAQVVTLDSHQEQREHPLVRSFATDQLWQDSSVALLTEQEEAVVISPDAGGVSRAQRLADLLRRPLCIMQKRRSEAGVVELCGLSGEVRGKVALLRDDMVDTAQTAAGAAALLRAAGATKIYGLFTHPVLSDGAERRLQQAAFDGIFFTNSLSRAPLSGARIVQLEALLSGILRQRLASV